MRLKPSPKFVRSALAGHSVLGLTAAALLYVVAVSGTFGVFHLDFERWEYPAAPEMQQVSPAAVERAAHNALAGFEEPPDYLGVLLPTAESPRIVVRAGETSRYAAADGSLLEEARLEWTRFLMDLHMVLNLSTSVGLVVVGLTGLMLVALIVSGLLAHPNLFRDAFSLRLGGAERLRHVELHNRLAVWASPFHLVVALTGAFLGLGSVLMFVIAVPFYGGDTEAAAAPLDGVVPEPSNVAAPLADIDAALIHLASAAPNERPFHVIVYEPATTAQLVEVRARVPRRLTWAELYYYDADGDPAGAVGWSSGEIGTQINGSVHRIHFGFFGGLPVRIGYGLLGLALCGVIATGVNIWLTKRRLRGAPAARIERAWTAVVWGVPLGVALSAVGSLALDLPPVPLFWTAVFGLALAAAVGGDRRRWSLGLRIGVAAASTLIVVVHALRFPGETFAAPSATVNLLWLALAVAMAASVLLVGRATSDAPAPVTAAASARE